MNKQLFRRTASLCLALAMLLTLFPLPAGAAEADSGSCGDNVTYSLTDGGTLSIAGAGEMENYSISNPAPWHAYITAIQTIEIASGVTSIGSSAFSSCRILKNVSISDSVSSIGRSAFEDCSSLERISIPASVRTIGAHAFDLCSDLAYVTFFGSASGQIDGTAFSGSSHIDFRYPSGDTSWNSAVSSNETYGATTATWIPCSPSELTASPSSGESHSSNPPVQQNPEGQAPSSTTVEELLPAVVAPPPAQEIESPIQKIVKAEEHPASWMERINPPDYAVNLYDVLVDGANEDSSSSGGDSMADCLIQDEFFTVDGGSQQGGASDSDVQSVERVDFALSDLYADEAEGREILDSVVFAEDQFNTVDVSGGDRAVDYAALQPGDVIRTPVFNGVFITKVERGADFDAQKKEICSYIGAAYQAFDRDHPEVFWLNGKCRARITTVKDPRSGVQMAYFFLSLADKDGFTMRAPAWTAPGAVAEGLQRRDAAVDQILRSVTAETPADQLKQLNRWLTEHNEYNTTADLTAIGNEPHECLSALEGRIGTTGPVCDGYSRAFKVLCDSLKIPCVLENGYAKPSETSSGSLHMWNSVQLNSAWYGTDVTWNDPIVKGTSGAKSGRENERYLLVGSSTEIRGMTFAASHPATNRAATGGVSFYNGPILSSVAFSALTYNSGLSDMPFTDISSGGWSADAVQYVYQKGLMSGTSATTFSPKGSVNRQQMWMILARLSGEKPADMSAARAWAVTNGISDGSKPTESLTRQQMAVLLYRAAALMGRSLTASKELSAFSDAAQVSSYAQEAMSWAVGNGILTGSSGGRLNPSGTATREQFAVVLQRFCEQ